MKKNELRFNQIVNERMEKFAKEKNLGTIKIVFSYHYVENYEKSSITLFKVGKESFVYESKDISDNNWQRMLMEQFDIGNMVLTPLVKWDDITMPSADIYGSNYEILPNKILSVLKEKTTLVYEDQLNNIYKDCQAEISKENFKVEIPNLTVKEFDKLTANKKKIEEYILKLAKEG